MSVAAGVLAIVYPDITLLALGIFAGVGLLLGLGIIDAILGILILSLPGLSLVTLAVLFAISLLVRGMFMVFLAFKLRGARHHAAAVPA